MLLSKSTERGIIKSTNHRPLTHQPIDPLTTDPPTRFYIRDLIIKKYLFYKIETQPGKFKTIFRSI